MAVAIAMRLEILTTVFCIPLLLSACGGGGSSSRSSAPAPEPAPVPAPPAPPPPEPAGFNISGTVTSASNLRIDGDTNNPDDESIPNNTLATAQNISSPVTLGGYVNQPGTGDTGQSSTSGDIEDYFRVELLAGQTITLLIADSQRADTDLYLYDSTGELIDYSIETGEIESIGITESGTYLVNVFAAFGASNYTLAIGSTPFTPARRSSSTSDNIIPWQAVVEYHDREADASATDESLHNIDRRMGITRRAGRRGRPRLMAMERKSLSQAQSRQRLGKADGKRQQIRNPGLRARWETLMTIKSLRRDPAVVLAEPNYRVQKMAIPDDEAYPLQWHYPLINLPSAWDMTTGTPEVVVAVIDTGILRRHPDMAGQLVSGYDFIANPQTAGDGNGIDPNPEDEGDGDGAVSSSFHGTHVSGTVAATSNNGIGVAGVAWNARIMPIRVLGINGGTSYDVDQGIRYAAGLENDSGTVPTKRADIINLSLAGGGFSQAEQNTINRARNAGVIIVAAAGNEGSSTPSYPASYDGVISVSAVDSQRRVTPYSNFGSSIDVAAPGGDNGVDLNGDGYPDGVLSPAGSDTGAELDFVYSFFSGTSMASPHVAGVIALMKSVNPGLTPADIDAMLALGELSDDLGAAGRDDLFGYGLINAQRAVAAALTAGGNPPADNPRLDTPVSALNFSSAATELDLLLQNGGTGELELLELSASESWLDITVSEVDENGLGVYRIAVDRDGLAPGVYTGVITAVSAVNTLTINIFMSVVDSLSGGSVGTLYILLFDAVTQEFVQQSLSAGIDGFYSYLFTDIPAGSYEIFAGSDSDNDQFICDEGEACGAWLTVDQPVSVELESDTGDIDFPVEFRVLIPTVGSASEGGINPAGMTVGMKRE